MKLGAQIRRAARRLSPDAQEAAWRIEGNLRELEKDLLPSTRREFERFVRNDLEVIETERAK